VRLLVYLAVLWHRLRFACGRTGGVQVDRHGGEHLDRLQASGRGGLLLSAHLGTLACLRALPTSLPLTLLVSLADPTVDRLNRLFARLDRARPVRLLGAGTGLEAVMKVKEAIARGELVAVLADRSAHDPRPLSVEFLGGRREVPAGPFVLAAVLKCPVLLGFGLFRGGGRYDFHCEVLADKVVLPPGDRETALTAVAQRYAERLAHHVAMQPDNWFEFFARS
jgi:predicted LPLAT superfamily acyltransferase